ncbi:transposase, partial [Ligilactobacillus agilis]
MSRKSKYSVEQKLNILNEAVHSSFKRVAKKYGVNESTILTWYR